jgi:hypothetical protein
MRATSTSARGLQVCNAIQPIKPLAGLNPHVHTLSLLARSSSLFVDKRNCILPIDGPFVLASIRPRVHGNSFLK